MPSFVRDLLTQPDFVSSTCRSYAPSQDPVKRKLVRSDDGPLQDMAYGGRPRHRDRRRAVRHRRAGLRPPPIVLLLGRKGSFRLLRSPFEDTNFHILRECIEPSSVHCYVRWRLGSRGRQYRARCARKPSDGGRLHPSKGQPSQDSTHGASSIVLDLGCAGRSALSTGAIFSSPRALMGVESTSPTAFDLARRRCR